ncbi:glutamine synthetase family protein [Verrucomicrobia bacterium]|jgi:glutamine synthetase|nr:glutamine synthetase family protein [Verrucomicrobiota bacterium]MDB4665376.1 glutamine synthetase family protein [Verrucomicrobiota bacterium]MDG1890942.1 glutamine synthetase family protein [Verrucomicrobiota bacterium]
MDTKTLKSKIKAGEIDTVIVAFPDALGRLVGKRFTGAFYLKQVADHGTHGCNYLLTVNMEMDPMDGFKVANWENGFGDFMMKPDPASLKILTWQPGTALVICDYLHHDGSPVMEAPRSVLKRQLDRLVQKKIKTFMASELEFFIFNQDYSKAFDEGYGNLRPSSDYRIDYHILQPGREEPILRCLRNELTQSGIPVECSKGEWSRGQHEINVEYAEALETADRHVIFKQAVKEIVHREGKSATFIPKFAEEEAGNSCHIHISLQKAGKNLFWDSRGGKPSKTFKHFLGGLLKYSPELCLFFAPTINAYKRYQSGSWAPTRMAWSMDNRTAGFRVVGHGPSFRIENRMPGADANPYLAFAAMLIAGMAGIDEKLDCPGSYEGNAYMDESLPALPGSLEEAKNSLNQSTLARETLGDAVVDFYVRTAQLEIQAFASAVTDWERQRYFERI